MTAKINAKIKAEKKKPDIVHAMVGTAGHVSHGKSTLVEMLTGCRMNRLPEEKARGLTIDLGFAACFLPGSRVVGIVDVPGHRDFIRNMVAGASSIDIVMLVVAADDGVMPQTEEHVKVARLLGAKRLMVVITKTDLVDAEMIELVREDVADFMARSGFGDARVIKFSSKTLEGLDEVRDTLEALLASVTERAGRGGAFRANVERVFSVKGYGTVATGMPVSGEVRPGDEVEILPAGRRTTVRAIQTYKYDSDAAVEGACSAINLRDVSIEDVTRGMTLAAPGVFRATDAVLATLANVSEKVALKRRMEVRFHSGTAAVNASLRLVGAETLPPGRRGRPSDEGFAELRFAEPFVVAAGDRYILRSHSPQNTVGGGVVLSSRVGRLRRKSEGLLERLALAREAVLAGDVFACELMAGPSPVLETDELTRLTQCAGEAARSAVAERRDRGDVVELGGRGWMVRARVGEAAAAVRGALARYHEENRYASGMEPAHCASLVGLGEKSFARLAELLAAADPEIVLKRGRLALASFKPALSNRQMKLREEIARRAAEAGAKGIARGNLMTETGASEPDMKLLARLMSEDGTLTIIGRHIMHAPAFEECRRKLLALFDEKPNVDMAAFREATGLARNNAVAVLEHFDSEGLTRREGKGRVLLRRPAGG